MRIFLSYAGEDAASARAIYERLLAGNHEVFNWRAGNEGERFIEATERAIREADYFFALVSPSFLASNWCREERNYALRCEHDLNGDRQFIHVLQISQVNPRDAGYIGNYGWLDATRPEAVAEVLDALLERLNRTAQQRAVAAAGVAEAVGAPAAVTVPVAVIAPDTPSPEVAFRNRDDELEKVLRGLTNAAGPHFWLVLGPPQLGKTWFLDRIGKDQQLTEPPGWLIRRIDLRDQAPAVRADADGLLRLMFARPPARVDGDTVDGDTLREIAVEIIHSRQPHLYLLDSAELLDAKTVGRLRAHLRPIYQWVLEAGLTSSRLAVIVASRQHEGWDGLRPDPRVLQLPLTEFSVDVVQTALRDMGKGRVIGEEKYRDYAMLAHTLTEGLPALLARCLQWVVDQEWTALDRMARQDTFRRLAGPYIESELLTSESLFPGDAIQGDGKLLALQHAYRLLAPYRLFTRSHLQHHLERDPDLTDILGRVHWSVTDLWQAIIGTALTRPSTEPWQRIHPAVRRLLYRYFYESDESAADAALGGIEAHREAARFIKVWTENQNGTEQVVGLVECLWHDANVLLSGDPVRGAEELIASARALSEDLLPSNAYSLEELREYAEILIRGDDEFQRRVSSVDGLFDRLVGVVCSP